MKIVKLKKLTKCGETKINPPGDYNPLVKSSAGQFLANNRMAIYNTAGSQRA